MDTQTDSSGALDTHQAAAAFAEMLDPQPPVVDKVEPEAKANSEQEQPAAEEDAQANPDAEADAQDDDPVVSIKVDGKDIEVRLSELKRGYQKDAAANQRFEQAAEVRKAAEAETQKAQAERNAYAQNLQRFQIMLEGALQERQKTDWQALLESDPVEYLKQQRLDQERQAVLQRVYAEQQQLSERAQAERARSFHDHIIQQQQELIAKLPEWRDEAKAKAEKSALREYLLTQGFDEQSVDGVSDARTVVLARKAMLHDQMMAKAAVAAKKVATLPQKVERSGTGDNPGIDRRSSSFQKLSKSGRVEDAAAVFAGLL